MSTWNVSTEATLNSEQWAINASRGALLAVAVIFGLLGLAGQTPSLEAQMGIYLVGMVALNLPHGGYEHFENLRWRGLPFGARYVLLYLSFIGGFVALFFLAPLVALNPLGNATALPGVVAFYTVFICIVALPHVVGEWLDRFPTVGRIRITPPGLLQ